MSRVRVRFTKVGKVRFTSHRDMARVWERALARAGWPVALSEGFSPRPRLHFGLALPTGAESLAEFLDVDLRAGAAVPATGPDALDQLDALLPPGVEVAALAPVDRGTSLQQAVTSCTWELDVEGWRDEERPEVLADAVAGLLAATTLPVEQERKGKRQVVDVRPAVRDLTAGPSTRHPGEGPVLFAELATQPRALRPAELLELLGVDPLGARVCRLHQWIDADGERGEPLAASSSATPAEVRA